MKNKNKPQIIIFGAGNIGRSFIAPVFTNGGYEAVFADVSPAVLDALKERSSYTLVEITDNNKTEHEIQPVRAIHAGDFTAVAEELEKTEICATSVGAGALPAVLKTIAQAVKNRKRPLDIILAENLKGASALAKSIFEEAGIPAEEQKKRIGFIETSIGKMVPIMPDDLKDSDPLLCYAEPYNTLIVDKDAFKGRIPEIPDLMPVSPIAPWVARKLYIHNFGHAAAAYTGHVHNPDAVYIWETLENNKTSALVEKAMKISAEALLKEYPEIFSREDLFSHVEDLISRFRNRALGDTVYRVGRDLKRKLNRFDRVVGALELANKHNLDTGAHLEVFTSALQILPPPGPDGKTDPQDAEVVQAARKINPEDFLKDIVRMDPVSEPRLAALLIKALNKLRGKS